MVEWCRSIRWLRMTQTTQMTFAEIVWEQYTESLGCHYQVYRLRAVITMSLLYYQSFACDAHEDHDTCMVAKESKVWHGIWLSHVILFVIASIVQPLFDFTIFYYFCVPSSIFHPPSFNSILWSSTYISIFHLLFLVHTSLHCLLTSVSHIPSLCSFAPFLFLSLHHLSIISCLLFLTLTTLHFISCDSASHLLHSPYHSEPCSIKFFLICTCFPRL